MTDKRNLVIVESPTKTKKLTQFLGKGFTVKSSVGHITELPKSKLGVDEDTFEPVYILDEKKKDVAKDLTKVAKESDMIYLATDEDREGEAIGWQVARLLNKDAELKEIDGKFYLHKIKNKLGNHPQVLRVTFNSITKDAVLNAFDQPRNLDFNVINAQQARRVLDRLVGYKLSPLLWSKIRFGLSAGRVQSVATRLVVEREKEIQNFPDELYYELLSHLKTNNELMSSSLVKIDDKDIYQKLKFNLFATEYTATKTVIDSKDILSNYVKDIQTGDFIVKNVSDKETKSNPSAPFTTSSIQQTASTALGLSPKNTMRIAQKLYEHGFITYMRTDSTYIIPDVIKTIRSFVKSEYGTKYVHSDIREYHAKKGAITQDAHEAIRPTDCTKLPSSLPKSIGEDGYKLYNLIWQRTIASQMSSAVYDNSTIQIVNKGKVHTYLFETKGSVLKFDGYTKVYKVSKKDTVIPRVKIGDKLSLDKIEELEKKLTPPPRYNESSLVKELEKFNIGRPSTYATIISTIQSRGYVKNLNKVLYPTDSGIVVNKLLSDHFTSIVDIDFTANMENDLDEVADGKLDWKDLLKDFYYPFRSSIEDKNKTISKEDYVILEQTDEVCPECGKGKLILKLAKYGKFYSCNRFPDCKYGKPFLEDDPNTPQDESLAELQEELAKRQCPDCGGDLQIKQSRYGKFIGCSNYPKCKHTESIEQKIGMTCPKCKKGDVVVKTTKRGNRNMKFFGCNQYPNCDFISNKNPLELSKEEIQKIITAEKKTFTSKTNNKATKTKNTKKDK